MPEETIASMVSRTLCSVSVMPEFQEFQPSGGNCGCDGGAGALHAASTPTQATSRPSPRMRSW